MAEPTKQELDAFFKGGATQTTNTPGLQLAPLTTQASQSTVNAIPKAIIGEADRKGQRRDDTGGWIILDIDEGLPLTAYERIAQQRLPEDKFKVLRNMYPDKVIRTFPDGEMSIEVNDAKTGKPKDVMLNPSGIDIHDLADLAVQTPEIAAGIAGALASKGTGAIRTFGQILTSAFAAGTAGAARDVSQRVAEGLPIREEEIANTRISGMASEAIFEGALGVAGKGLRVLSPFSRTITPGTLAFDANRGAKNLENAFDEKFKRSPGERTGFPFFQKIEAAEKEMPGSSMVIGAFQKKFDETLFRIQRRALGKVSTQEEVGTRALDALEKGVVQPMEDAFAAARKELLDGGDAKLLKQFDDLTGIRGPGGRITPFEAGGMAKDEFQTNLAAARAKKDAAYQSVRDLPGGTEKIIPGNPLVRAAKEIEDELAKITEKVEVETVDRYGSPTSKTVERTKILPSGVPDSLTKFLADMKAQGGQKMTLQELTNLKNAARDEIAKTEAVPGVKDRWFKMVSKAYSDAIEEGVEGIKDPALKNALANAKKTYIDEVLPFDENGISDIARTSFEAGFKGNKQIIERLFTGGQSVENFRALKGILGKDSIAIRAIKRSFLDTELALVQDSITKEINPKKLHDVLNAYSKNHPEMGEEIFGKRFREVALNLRSMAVGHMDDLPVAEVKMLLDSGTPVKRLLKAFENASKLRTDLYNNSLYGDVQKGIAIGDKVQPMEFVRRMSDTSFPTKKVEEILKALEKEAPDVRDMLATAEMYRIFAEASVDGVNAANRTFRGEPVNLHARKLAEVVGPMGGDKRKRIELLLGEKGLPLKPGEVGPTRINVIGDLIGLLGPAAEAQKGFASLGTLGRGSMLQKIYTGPLAVASATAKKAILATVYRNEKFGDLLANTKFSPEAAATWSNNLIASEPFIQRMIMVFGPEAAQEIVSSAKTSIDSYLEEQLGIQKAERKASEEGKDADEIERFFRGESARIKTRAVP